MAGVNPRLQHGPQTYEANANIAGKQLVESTGAKGASGRSLVQPAGANSVVCVGVAAKDAVPLSGQDALINAATADPGAFPVTNLAVPNETLAVYNDVLEISVYYAATATFRQPLKCAASGQVTPWVDGTDAVSRRIGWCAQPGGVGAVGYGLARINI